MPVRQTYWLDGADFRSSTSIFTNELRTAVAADGWYSAEGVSRQMVGGVLSAPIPCPDNGGGIPSPTDTLDWEVQLNLDGELVLNITNIDFKIDIDTVNYVFASSATTGTAVVPKGNGTVDLTVDYDEPFQSLSQLVLRLESPAGTLLAQDITNLPQPGQFSVNASFNMNAARTIVAQINGS